MTSRFSCYLWLAFALICGNVIAQDNIRWAPDLPQARAAAAQFKVPLLIHFYGDHCLPCKTLEQRVLSQQEVVETLNKYFICLRINASQDRLTAAEFQVHSWPTDVFVSPDGKTLYQGICPQDLRNYISTLENVAVMNRDRNTMLAAAQPTQPAATIAQQSANVGSGSVMSSQIPAPGSQTTSGSLTPSFYTASDASKTQQALPVSASPMQTVQSGPLIASSQPAGITGSTPGSQQQLASPAPPDFNNDQHGGQLPPRQEMQAQIAAPPDRRSQADSLAGFPQIPHVGPAQVVSHPQRQAYTGKSQTVDNPYFTTPNQQLHAGPMTTSPAVADTPIPAHAVSFQPRGVAPPTAVAAAPVAEPATPGIGGYCPIALRSSGQWVEGQPQFAVKHRGRVYWLSSRQAMQDFLKSPDAASPVLQGYDPMIFLTEGRLVEGDLKFGLHEEVGGKILFFASEQSKQQFETNYDKNSRALNVILDDAGVR